MNHDSGRPGDSDKDDDFGDSDREWLAALSGQIPREEARSSAARQGVGMRAALERRAQSNEDDPLAAQATSDEAMEHARRRLLERARAEGLLERRASPDTSASAAPSNVVEFPWWRRRRSLVGIAASVLVGAIALRAVVDRPDYGEPPILSGAGGVLHARAVDPKSAADELATQLESAGLRPGRYQRGKTFVVDVQLMAAELASAKPAFAALGLEPTVGFNRIEIASP